MPTWILPDWPAPPAVHAAVTTRDLPGFSQPPFGHCNLGLRSGEEVAVVARNRARVATLLDLPRAPLWLHQVHGTQVAVADDPVATGLEPAADASVSGAAGAVLAILTADCLPVVFCSVDGARIGVAHAGWRGLAAGVLEATVAALGAAPDAIMAWLGPCIGPASYEVDAPVRDAFGGVHAPATAFTPTRPGHWQADLALLARARLRSAGVERIFGGGFDTFTDERLYSYRREGARSGRFATLVWRSPA